MKTPIHITNYVRKCNFKTGYERSRILHAANNNYTFCGKELNEMWFVESSAVVSVDDINCKKCLKVINERNKNGYKSS